MVALRVWLLLASAGRAASQPLHCLGATCEEGDSTGLLQQFGRAKAVLTVSLGEPRQTLQHWGTTLGWWANGVGGWKDEQKLDELMALFFKPVAPQDIISAATAGQVPQGLGLSFARYNIGGGDQESNYHFYRPGGSVENYWRSDGTWDWSADGTQRRALRAALNAGLQSVEAFSNSPPWWMTTSQSSTGNTVGWGSGSRTADQQRPDGKEARTEAGALLDRLLDKFGGVPNLAPENNTKFAEYLATVVKRFAKDADLLFGRTLVFDTVIPLNEPSSTWWTYGNSQEGCIIRGQQQTDLIKGLHRSLRAKGVTRTKIAAPEENTVGLTVLDMKRVYDNETLSLLKSVNTHTYGLQTLYEKQNRQETLASWAASTGIPVWNSEYGTGKGPLQGGLNLAYRIVYDLTNLRVPVWTLWQVADLDNTLSTGEGEWGQTAVSYCGCNPSCDQCNGSSVQDFKVRKQYYAYKQFTAFLRPGSKIFAVSTGSKDISAIAGKLPDSEVLAIVVINTAQQQIDMSMAGFSGARSLGAYRTDGSSDCELAEPATSSQGNLAFSVPPESITTYLVDTR